MTQKTAAARRLFHAGNQHLASGALAAAETCFREAVRLAPTLGEAFANLALVLDQTGQVAAAEAAYRQALALCPEVLEIQLNLGGLLCTQKRFDEALRLYQQALDQHHDSPALWSNLGVLHVSQQQEAQAEHCYRAALTLDPQHTKARFNLAYLLLRQGRFEEGWSCLEARDWYAGLTAYFECPRWQGEPLAGKSLLIGFEAGHGDMIQFARYAVVLKTQGAAHISLLCHPALKALFTTLDGVDTVMAFDEDVPHSGWDYWTPPLSLPLYCQTREDSIPAAIPYLHAEPQKQAQWAQRLSHPIPAGRGNQALKVGLVWRGNPQFENDSDRSIHDMQLLLPLGSIPGIRLFSLHKGAGEPEALSPPPGLALTHLGALIEDFTDTAAIMRNLDLVISVDTAAAHLAGALGVPCWLLLPGYLTDWRWMKDRPDSPWYPNTMRLFRQQTAGDWKPVIAALCEEIRVKLA